MPPAAVAGVAAVGGIAKSVIGSKSAKKASSQAADSQLEAARVQAESQERIAERLFGIGEEVSGGLTALGDRIYDSTIKYGQVPALSYLEQGYQGTRDYLDPIAEKGMIAYKALYDLYGLGGEDAQEAAFYLFKKDPGYQFRQKEGLKELDRYFSARGKSLSGDQSEAIVDYSQGVASNEFDKFVNRLDRMAMTGVQTRLNQANIRQTHGAQQADTALNSLNTANQARLTTGIAAGNARLGAETQGASALSQGASALSIGAQNAAQTRLAGSQAASQALAGGIDDIAGAAGLYYGLKNPTTPATAIAATKTGPLAY